MIPRLHLILDLDLPSLAGRDLPAIAVAAARGGVGAVHLRTRKLPARELLTLAQVLRAALDRRAILLINDRLDVALAMGADGVQLPGTGLPADVVRAMLEEAVPARQVQLAALSMPGFLIGCSVHSVEEARAAEAAHADYLLLGTIFASASHPAGPTGGEALVRAARAASRLPLIAIGGITSGTAARAVAAGADGVAAIRAIAEAEDAAAAAAALLHDVERGYVGRASRGDGAATGVTSTLERSSNDSYSP